jgi:hypothetical protein
MRTDAVPPAKKRRVVLRRFRQQRFWALYGVPGVLLASVVLNEMHVDDLLPEPFRIAAYIFITAVAGWHVYRAARMLRVQRRSRSPVWSGPEPPPGLPLASWGNLARAAGDQGGGQFDAPGRPLIPAEPFEEHFRGDTA